MNGYIKNDWKDRIVEFPNRYKIEKDENSDYYFLTQEAGNIAKTGTPVVAEKMNNIENGIFNNQMFGFNITLPVSNWTQNTTTNLYEYNVTKEDITANHFVDIVFDSASKKMLSDVDVNSYDGGFILTTEELPEGELKGTVYYNLVSIGGDSVEG